MKEIKEDKGKQSFGTVRIFIYEILGEGRFYPICGALCGYAMLTSR